MLWGGPLSSSPSAPASGRAALGPAAYAGGTQAPSLLVDNSTAWANAQLSDSTHINPSLTTGAYRAHDCSQSTAKPGLYGLTTALDSERHDRSMTGFKRTLLTLHLLTVASVLARVASR